ncbi:MAG: sugar phosphate isomerase/epimerase [Candidatus Aminicenantes bacterium]|jgi:sugar phosphate isomerase/epimerase
MKKTNRRDFMKTAGMGITAVSLSSFSLTSPGCRATETEKAQKRLSLGMASYTFRKFPLEETLAMTKRLGLKKIALKSFHLPLESTEEEIKAVARKVKDAGLELYGCGVVYMENEEEVNRAFNYAQTAGMKVIIGVPEHGLLGLVNDKVKEFDIQVAIHNHGPTDKRYPTPESAYERIKELDHRIGLCIDIGHTQRCGVDPPGSAWKFADRLLDVHIKDVSAAAGEGTTVEIGRGVIDIPRFVRTLLNLNYKGNASFEFEKDADDPLPGVAESVGYVRGVLAAL